MGGYRLESYPNKNDGQMVFITFECASVDDIVQGEIRVTCWWHSGATHVDKHYKCSRWKFKKKYHKQNPQVWSQFKKTTSKSNGDVSTIKSVPEWFHTNNDPPYSQSNSMQRGCPFRAVQARIHGHLTSDKNDPEISTEKTCEPPKHWVFFMKKFGFSHQKTCIFLSTTGI